MNIREQLKAALSDPKIEGLNFLDKHDGVQIHSILRRYSGDFYISVWEYEQLCRMEYHLHSKEKGLEIKKLYDQQKRGGYPSLVGIYSRQDLETFLSTELDTPQTLY